MPNNRNVSRRRFLKSSGALTGASLLRIGTPALIAITEAACSAKQEAAPFASLNVADAADLAAIAARIMPTTDTPGATEAGVIYFIDRALGAEMQGMLEGLQAGLLDLNSRVTNQHTGSGRFAELDRRLAGQTPGGDRKRRLLQFPLDADDKRIFRDEQLRWQ